ncbi:MAG: hypothetical protein AMXMBFR33_33500 [Candidatus Xenobia bacterium]
MKKHAWCAAALFASLTFGCGGDSAATNTGGNDVPDPLPLGGSFRLDLGAFGPGNVADLLFFTTPANGNASLQVNLDNQNREPVSTRTGEETCNDSGGEGEEVASKDLPPDVCAAERSEIARAIKQRANGGGAGVQPRFEQVAQGSDITFFVVGPGNLNCRKILDETQTTNCVIFAEVRNGQPVLSTERALAIAQAWDTNNPARPGAGIYAQVRAAFGSEWTTNGGRDGDSKIVLVFCSGASIGSSLFGFFRPSDEFSKAEIGTSNEGEILYLNADKSDFDTLATMAHEFQHMVRFNQKLIQQGTFAGTAENDTIDEGASMNAEELCGYSLDAAGGGNRFMFQGCQSYLEQAADSNLFDGFNGALRFYGGGYLLVKYFREQFGQTAFVTFNTNTGIGFSNMASVAGLSQAELFRRFSLALLTSGFTGSVPPEGRFPSGFSTQGSFNINELGAVSLPGLQPSTVLNPPSSPSNLTVVAFAPTLVRLQGGSGQNLVVEGTTTGEGTLQAVTESTVGVVASTAAQTLGAQARAEDQHATTQESVVHKVTPPENVPQLDVIWLAD